jgi:hypothetical protein
MQSRATGYSSKLFTLWMVLIIASSLFPLAAGRQPVKAFANEVVILPGDPIEIAMAWSSCLPEIEGILDAAEMALDDYGPIRGFAVQRHDYDSACDETAGENTANDIVANGQNVGVIGPIVSISTIGAAPVFEANGIVMISPSNTRSDLGPYGPNVFNRVVVEDPDYFLWDQKIRSRESVQGWEAEFLNRYGREPVEFEKYAYDSATLLLTRIEQVSQLNGGNLHIDRMKLAYAVRNTLNFSGVTGQIAFKPNGDRLNLFEEDLIYDPFSGAELDSGWSWIDEDPTHWNLAERPGFLRIITQQDGKNWVVRRAPLTNYEIRTRLLFTPAENFQIAGLHVYLDSYNYLTLGRAFCDNPAPVCVGNGIYFDHIENNAFIGSNFATVASVSDEVYLRLVRDGSDYTAFFSTGGTGWTELGTHMIEFVPQNVGLVALNQRQPVSEIPADFDYFILTYEYAKTFLPLTIR